MKLKFQFLSQFYSIKLYTHTIIYLFQMKVFSNVTNTHLYTNEKEIKHVKAFFPNHFTTTS